MTGLDPLRYNRTTLFWVLHTGGWLGYAITQYLGAYIYEKMTGYFLVIALAAVSGFLMSLELRYIYRRLWSRAPMVLAAGVLASCYVFALAWRVIINGSCLIGE